MESKSMKVLKNWPADSPDLNPIEHLCHHVKLRLARYPTKAKNIDILSERFDKEWDSFTKEDMQPYYKNMPKRIQQFINVKDGYTRH